METTNIHNNLDDIVLATLFVAGEGISKEDMADKFDCKTKDIDKAVNNLKQRFDENSGVQIISFNNMYQLSSNPKYVEEVASVLNPIREKALTKAVLETLSIIAYKQPITRVEMEDVRGVNCDYAIQVLIEQDIIEVVGRKDVVGKPLLYGTTDKFLKKFSLNSLDDLPDQQDILERIKVLHSETSKNLYNDFQIPEENEIPDYLEGEQLEKVEVDFDENCN